MRAADVVAIGDLAGEALVAGSGLVEEMHEAIADRPFGALGQAAGPVRAIHDGIARTAYASVRTGLRAASRAGAAAAAIRLGGDRLALAETRGGTVALAALNAVYGDRTSGRSSAWDRLTSAPTSRRARTSSGWTLQRIPETRALGTLVNARSAGIKDLRFGSCTEEDWRGADADEFLSDRCREVPFLPDANYYFVAAAVAGGRLGAVAGDLLVRVASASGRGDGRGRHIPFAAANGVELTGLNHFDLLHHPLVYSELRRWLS